MSISLLSKIAIGLRQVSADMLKQTQAFQRDVAAERKLVDRINGYAAELEAHLAEPVEGTHVFDMIAAMEKGNVEITETLIHMVAATVLSKLIEEEGGGRSNVSFSPADMDAMHRDYEMSATRDGLITTVTITPRNPRELIVTTDRLMTQEEDTEDALPQGTVWPERPFWFFHNGDVRQRVDNRATAERLVFESKNPLARVENRMCSRVECPNSERQGECVACSS